MYTLWTVAELAPILTSPLWCSVLDFGLLYSYVEQESHWTLLDFIHTASCILMVCAVNECVFQVSVWLNERNAVALDESWREPTNLQAKVLKHQSFEAEILANHYRVDTLTKVCVCVCECVNRVFGYER